MFWFDYHERAPATASTFTISCWLFELNIFFQLICIIKGTFDKVVWLPYNMDISISWWGYLSLKYKVISDFIGISNRILIYCWITMTFPRPFDFLDCNYNVIPLILSLFFFFFFFIVFLFISHSISFLSLFPYLTPDRISLIFFANLYNGDPYRGNYTYTVVYVYIIRTC
jgi:hypothetical protein